jgi:RimJ/RimL family protein N-acetyltransferase
MPSNIIIRPAKPSDLATLLKFEQAIIEYERPMEPNMMTSPFHYYDLSEMMQLDNAQVMVAEDLNAEGGTKLVGSGFIHIRKARHYLDHQDHGYLGFMYVDPEYRGKGINQMVVAQLTEWAKSKQLDVLCLTVFAQNQSAIRAYEKAGFYQNLIEMRLNLKQSQ